MNEWLADALPGEPDWLEVHNRDSQLPVSLEGLQFVVGGAVARVATPAFVAPGGFLVLEADGGGGPGRLGFKLPAGGGSIALHDPEGRLLEVVEYAVQAEGVSAGRLPDGSDRALQTFMRPTPGRANAEALFSRPVLDQVRWEHGLLRFRVGGDVGGEYRIERSEDLRRWTPVWSGRPASLPFEGSVTAESATGGFCRVVVMP